MHIMLTGLTAPLQAGEQLPATLRFAKTGAKAVTIMVRDASAQ
jgi:copper(I)-binding protein